MFNAEKWISRLLESILVQTYSNLEVIVVNDGSTDLSAQIVRAYAIQSVSIDIHLIEQRNLGVSVARNVGAMNADGDYLAFVDSDDVWSNTKIKRQMDELISSKLPVVACAYAMFRGNDSIVDVVIPNWSKQGVLDWLLLRSYGGLLSSSLLIEKRIFEKVGIFRSDLSLSADIEFAWRLLKVTPVALVSEALVGYRLRPNQMHRVPDLLLAESSKMLEVVDLFQQTRFQEFYIANLYLRLSLYSFENFNFPEGLGYLIFALKSNFRESTSTLFRIIGNRVKRLLKRRIRKYTFFSFP